MRYSIISKINLGN